MTQEELNRRFDYHAPDAAKTELHQVIRNLHKDLAREIITGVPAGREQALALTKLEESLFWCNAGIAREGT